MRDAHAPRPRLYDAYREYVEFLSDLRLAHPFAAPLLAASSLVLLADLLAAQATQDAFLTRLSYLGLSTALHSLIVAAPPALFYAAAAVMVALLLAPGVAAACVAVAHWRQTGPYRNGVFKRQYEEGVVSCGVRAWLGTFVLLWLPVTASLAVKFMRAGGGEAAAGSAILVLALLDCLLVEYHTFEFGREDQSQLVVINHPYRIVDHLLSTAALVAANASDALASQLIAVLLLGLRLALTRHFPFYAHRTQRTHQLTLLAALIAACALLVASFAQQYYLFLLIAAALLFLLTRASSGQWERLGGPVEGEEGEALGSGQAGEGALGALRVRLFGEKAYVRAFRQLILLSRRNNSHRTQLEIEILKSKCTELEAVNRGGARRCSSNDVVAFEELVVRFLENLLGAAEMGVSLLKFLQHREGRTQILAKNVQRLMDRLVENKQLLRRMLELNEYSGEARFLLGSVYGAFYQDQAFLKEMERWSLEAVGLLSQKDLKEQFFSDKTTVVFINVLEEIGKIVRISKNLPGVLGFAPSNLIGLSINEIIPFSLKPHHDAALLSFINRCTDRDSYRAFELQFYAYNSDFHLQEVKVRYNWVMSDFHTLMMAGVIERVDSDANVILTDQHGFLEGWTKKIGTEELNLDELSIAERNNFNILPLFPTLVKYIDSLGVYVRTLFFKNQKSRDPGLILDRPVQGEEALRAFQGKALGTFRRMLKQEQLVGACFAEVQVSRLSFCRGAAVMLRFVIKHFEHVENFSEVGAMIETLSFNTNSNRTDKSIAEPTNEVGEGSEKQELSIFSEDEKADRRIDSNFTLLPEGPHIFPIEQLVFGQFSASRTSFELTNIYQNHLHRRPERPDEKAAANAPESNFAPTLSRSGSLMGWVAGVTVAAVVLVSVSVAGVAGAGRAMEGECAGVLRRNVAAMVYLKSIFNPNATYVGRFVNGALLENQPYLFAQTANYTSFLGDRFLLNKYYLFNTQIPATLHRLLQNPLPTTSNATVPVIPPTAAAYYNELALNYLTVVVEYDRKFGDTLAVWGAQVQSVRSGFFARLGVLCVCAGLYAWLLVAVRLRERGQRETLEAFFKFEKEELERKIAVMGAVVRQVEAQAAEWHLLKEFHEAVKRQEITNLEFALVKNPLEVKIKFDYSPETEDKLEKRKYYLTLLVLLLFLALMVLFLALHAVLTLTALAHYRQTPADLDAAAKLILLPNYMLADLYLPLPASIRSSYAAAVAAVLSFPVESVPDLYGLLSTAPCLDCAFMYPVLTTNFKSFYSTFEQRVVQMKSSGGPDNAQVSELFYAADYVGERVMGALRTGSYAYADLSVVVLAAALLVLCAAVRWGSRSVDTQIDTLELFLRFFTEEMLTKNKHMNRLFSNTS